MICYTENTDNIILLRLQFCLQPLDKALLTADFEVVGLAGEVVDLSEVLEIQTNIRDETFSNKLVTKNLKQMALKVLKML